MTPIARLALPLLLAAPFAPSQQTPTPIRTVDEVSTRLAGQPLMLRGFWADDDLNFDSTGQPIDAPTPGPFTLAGFNELSAKLDDKKLVLTGERIGVEFDAQGKADRVPLRASRHGKKTEMITIYIAAPADGDFAPALNAIFAATIRELAPALPEVWQSFAQSKMGDSSEAPELSRTAKQNSSASRVGGDVKPPKIKKSVDPDFTEAARCLKFSGQTQIYFWVEKDGHPDHIRIIKPAGLGLDEEAADAVSKYLFAPATQNGEPVKVDIFIDVNFQIR
jgi:TonB family protein